MQKRLKGLPEKLFSVTVWKRRLFFILSDALIILFSLYSGFWLRFDGNIPSDYIIKFPTYFFVTLIVKLTLLKLFGMYDFSWRFFSVLDQSRLTAALTLSSIILAGLLIGFRYSSTLGGMPRSVLLVDFVISLALMTALRISKRIYIEYLSRRSRLLKKRTKILIIGAGEAGNNIAQEMLRNPKSAYSPIGFIDDDPAKKGLSINRIKVLGTKNDVPDIFKSYVIDEVLIAIPSATSAQIKEFVEVIRKADPKKRIRVLPGILDLVNGRVRLADIKDISVDDLLGREQIKVDSKIIEAFIRDRRILITGAGGSIGSELVRTILQFQPSKILALDIDETELFNLSVKLEYKPDKLEFIIADIRDREKINRVFSKFRPEVVVHSAAYKHVPMLEEFPEEAVKTNVLGTKILAELAMKYQVEKFINISTDKAINPTSVMGSSKRIGEDLLRAMNRIGGTRFISVRFGNVLGSRGSVIPVFEEQIKRGGPVTVTHPDMKRYFMAISEAVILVLQAAGSGEGGEVFILDMGEPIKIVELAKEMIKLSGREPFIDIPIIYTGVRPGEKLFEELLGAEEGSEPTGHPKIFKAKTPMNEFNSTEQENINVELIRRIEKLIALSLNSAGKEEIIRMMKEIVPTYDVTIKERA